MDLTFGTHATLRLRVRSTSEAEVHRVVEHPDSVEVGQDQIRIYRALVESRKLTVVLAHDQVPPYVVTVMSEP
jgi:Domain of unknown function (DUF4258)